MTTKTCSKCTENKLIDYFIKERNICKDCNNLARRQQYHTDEAFRKKVIKERCESKHKKVVLRAKQLEEQQLMIGIENKTCRYCNVIKHKDRFRHNRLKCRDCERDDPHEKYKRYIRTRIYNCLKNHNKTKHSIDYLGCTTLEYSDYIFSYNESYNLENYGKIWHIDHVIPISKFDLNNQEKQLIAFNWRNTMPLSCRENLSKNNKIIKEQVLEHVIKLINYNKIKNLDLPQVYIHLFAKHLDAGNPLELLLPLTSGNICEELV
jgi:uncharacterized protein (DUF983 family)